MMKNHVRVFIRHISRHKLYAFINISGLAVGMAACILILLFIQDEVSYENLQGAANRMLNIADSLTPLLFIAFSTIARSDSLTATGFSQSTWRPASAAIVVAYALRAYGKQTTARSRFSFSIIS